MAEPEASPEALERFVDGVEKEQEEERAKRKQQIANPLGEEHLRKRLPPDTSREPRIEDPDRSRMLNSYEKMKHNGGSEDFDSGKQSGAIWRLRQKQKVLAFLARGADYRWILWKLKHDTGLVTETARAILDDAMSEEPENEPKGAPKPSKPSSNT